MKSYGNRRAIDQYTIEGDFLKSWRSIKDAAHSLGYTSQTISNCLRGLRVQAHGFVWKYHQYEDIPGEVFVYNDEYRIFVSDQGRLKYRSGKIATPSDIGGYKRIRTVNLQNKKVTIAIHRLVAKTFLLNPENKPEVNHIDRNKSNNSVKNLEWVTRQENMQHLERTQDLVKSLT